MGASCTYVNLLLIHDYNLLPESKTLNCLEVEGLVGVCGLRFAGAGW